MSLTPPLRALALSSPPLRASSRFSAIVEFLGDVHVLELRATVLSSTVESGLWHDKKLGLQDIETRDVLILDLGASALRELPELRIDKYINHIYDLS